MRREAGGLRQRVNARRGRTRKLDSRSAPLWEADVPTRVCPGRDSGGNGLLWKHIPYEPTHSLPQMGAASPHLGPLAGLPARNPPASEPRRVPAHPQLWEATGMPSTPLFPLQIAPSRGSPAWTWPTSLPTWLHLCSCFMGAGAEGQRDLGSSPRPARTVPYLPGASLHICTVGADEKSGARVKGMALLPPSTGAPSLLGGHA